MHFLKAQHFEDNKDVVLNTLFGKILSFDAATIFVEWNSASAEWTTSKGLITRIHNSRQDKQMFWLFLQSLCGNA